MEINDTKALRSVVLKLKTHESNDLFTRAQKYAVTQGQDLTGLITDLLNTFLSVAHPKCTLVTESEFIDLLEIEGITVSRPSLKRYRLSGVLEDEEGRWWFTNNRGSIVYNYEKMLQFLAYRKANPYTRLHPKVHD